MKQYVFEVIDAVAKERSREAKTRILKENNTGALQDLLRGTYDDRVVWLIPDGAPPYTPNNLESIPSNFKKECVNLKYLAKGLGYDEMLQMKREKIYIGILEAIHPRDAELVINMVSKKAIPGVSKAAVKEAFPKLLPN